MPFAREKIEEIEQSLQNSRQTLCREFRAY